MKELIAALIKAQQEIPPIGKDGNNPFHKSKYVTLDAIVSTVIPILGRHGLAITQSTESGETGFALKTQLWHTSGDCITSIYPLPSYEECAKSGGKTNPNQVMGSAITYARRYAISALLCLVSDEDDDGNMVTRKQQPPAVPPITDPNAIDWSKYTDKQGSVIAPQPSKGQSLSESDKFVLGWCDALTGVASRGHHESYKNGYAAATAQTTQNQSPE